MGALGAPACRLAGEIADGVLFNWLTPEHARQSAVWVQEGADAAGRGRPALYAYVRAAIGPGARARVEEAGAAYAAGSYGPHFARVGATPPRRVARRRRSGRACRAARGLGGLRRRARVAPAPRDGLGAGSPRVDQRVRAERSRGGGREAAHDVREQVATPSHRVHETLRSCSHERAKIGAVSRRRATGGSLLMSSVRIPTRGGGAPLAGAPGRRLAR